MLVSDDLTTNVRGAPVVTYLTYFSEQGKLSIILEVIFEKEIGSLCWCITSSSGDRENGDKE